MWTIAGVEVRGLCKSYQVDGRAVRVLQGLDLAIPGSGITVVVGKSGCGKTTLLRTLAGLEAADSGEIHIPSGMRAGIVFQEPRLMPWLNTWKNITFGIKRPDSGRIRKLVETVGLSGFERAYPSQLSGGMQQRAALARALAYDPDLILMDEPFAALDYFTRELMQRELLRIQRASGKGIVFVTHSIDEALLLGSQVVVLGEGRAKGSFRLACPQEERDLLAEDMIRAKQRILEAIQS